MRKLFGKQNFDIEPCITDSVETLRAMNAAHGEKWRLGQEKAWKVNEQVGRIIFSFADGGKVSAPVQVIGTYKVKEQRFHWAWDHPAVPPLLRYHALKLKEFAREKACAELLQQQSTCPERRAWEYTALAMVIAEANGAYRAQVEGDTFVFMTFGEVSVHAPEDIAA